MYAGVPMSCPVLVVNDSFEASFASVALAIPKSITFGQCSPLSLETRTFEGFMSR
jgi:hypothetical protein